MYDIPKHSRWKISSEDMGHIVNHSRNVTKLELIEEHEKYRHKVEMNTDT